MNSSELVEFGHAQDNSNQQFQIIEVELVRIVS